MLTKILKYRSGVWLRNILECHLDEILTKELLSDGVFLRHLLGVENHIHDPLWGAAFRHSREIRANVAFPKLMASGAFGGKGSFPFVCEARVDIG